MNNEISYWHRDESKIKSDNIYADWFVRWCYENRFGKIFLNYFFSKKNFNILYGLYKSSTFSAKQINKDITDFSVQMDLYENGPFRTYSDFFLRKFKPGVRQFPTDNKIMGAFAEGRVLGYKEVSADQKYPVKGTYLDSNKLLGNPKISQDFVGGPIIIIRLCPIDYHHFHFPDTGTITKSYTIGGDYHSVNILALKNKGDIFINNERRITILETENFGKLAYIEVGAMCVGKIIQEDPECINFKKGQLKGHFGFGASTVIVLGEPGKWIPSADILEYSAQNIESYIRLGDQVGQQRT
jgi:phosphatidylserine decarboxylase